jgi:predicted Zn finger-like uncharacterized protein
MAHLIECPECKKHLQVPDDLIGKRVQCPECKHTFTAATNEEPVTTISSSASSSPPSLPVPTKSKTPEWDKKASSSSKSPPKKKRRDEDDEEDDYDPDYRDDRDDEDDDDRPRRRRRRSSRGGGYMPHRGGMILAFGLVGLVGMGLFPVGLIFAIIAWIMGNSDMAEIRTGRMDPEGEGMTQAGRIMGMISTIIHIVSLVLAVVIPFGFCCFAGMIGAAGAGNRPPRRF